MPAMTRAETPTLISTTGTQNVPSKWIQIRQGQWTGQVSLCGEMNREHGGWAGLWMWGGLRLSDSKGLPPRWGLDVCLCVGGGVGIISSASHWSPELDAGGTSITFAHQEPRFTEEKACPHAKITNNTKQCINVLSYLAPCALFQKLPWFPITFSNVSIPPLAGQSPAYIENFISSFLAHTFPCEHRLHPTCFLPLYTPSQ